MIVWSICYLVAACLSIAGAAIAWVLMLDDIEERERNS